MLVWAGDTDSELFIILRWYITSLEPHKNGESRKQRAATWKLRKVNTDRRTEGDPQMELRRRVREIGGGKTRPVGHPLP